MKEIKIEIPEGKVIDLENSSLEKGIIKFKDEESAVLKWTDLKKVSGTFISNRSNISFAANLPLTLENINVAKDHETCNKMLATAMISQLKPYYKNKEGEPKDLCRIIEDNGSLDIYRNTLPNGSMLEFESEYNARLFIENNASLCLSYLTGKDIEL